MANMSHNVAVAFDFNAALISDAPFLAAVKTARHSNSSPIMALRIKNAEEEAYALRNSFVCALNQLLDLKDLNTGIHSTRLAEWALHVAGELGLDQKSHADIEVAALLHDIGKIGIPDAVLNKPSRLTPEEYDLMKKHPEYGWSVLRQIPGFERVSLLILHHHEGFDGKGYPGGLMGEEIPMGSRIVSVIDAFDAMVSSRPYREGLPFEEAERRLLEASGKQFDPAVVKCFLPLARAEMPAVLAAVGQRA
ncbi:MAG TPA: HD-GYP domain-containing protein [Candidatus Acidoferrum sp.]|nr:HD-GYP domain-containing protein [Candidatus Acidoferrum sp.]